LLDNLVDIVIIMLDYNTNKMHAAFMYGAFWGRIKLTILLSIMRISTNVAYYELFLIMYFILDELITSYS